MHQWVVASGLVEVGGHLLLVRNQRRGGWSDWSTPGGVVDASDASLLDALTREVHEETGIRVAGWEGPLYSVRAVAPDMGWTLRAEIHRAVEFAGEVHVDDPDGIVVEAAFVPLADAGARLARNTRWVGEPLGEWLVERWGPAEPREYRYHVRGTSRHDLSIVRRAP